MKTTDTVKIDGRTYTVVERQAPASATKAAAPHLSEILFLEGCRGAAKMAYLFASGEILIVI